VTALCCSTPARTVPRSPIPAISPAESPGCCTTGWPGSRSAPQESLSAGLDRLGYAAGDVKTAVISHLHHDHIGGLAELSHADIMVSQAEWDTLASPLAELRGLMRRHIDLPGLRWHRITAEPADDPGLAPFRSSHDLFGDGSLVLLPTPGHTPGSMSLLIRRPGWPPLMMVGDVTYDAHLPETGHVPGVGGHRHLREATAMINTMRQHYPGLVILPAHVPGADGRTGSASAGNGWLVPSERFGSSILIRGTRRLTAPVQIRLSARRGRRVSVARRRNHGCCHRQSCGRAQASECMVCHCQIRQFDESKEDHFEGTLRGRMALASASLASHSLRQLASGLSGSHMACSGNLPVIHGIQEVRGWLHLKQVGSCGRRRDRGHQQRQSICGDCRPARLSYGGQIPLRTLGERGGSYADNGRRNDKSRYICAGHRMTVVV
jgi:glyoxylase-like metal-dependent hydrolase (beta-lactamase superfamily II)